MRKEDKYLQKRGRHWHYVRRVPAPFADLDPRGHIRVSLDTNHIEVARSRRDAMALADDEFWSTLVICTQTSVARLPANARAVLEQRYRAARSRAAAYGFAYHPVEQLVRPDHEVDDLVARLEAVAGSLAASERPATRSHVEALLGGAPPPQVTIKAAFELYCDEIAIGELLNKSETQKKLWRKTKERAITYFVQQVGNKAMPEITRADALKFYNWWAERLKPKKVGVKRRGANTANRDLGNLRLLYRTYFSHIGEEDRTNPFRNLSFKDQSTTKVLPFETAFVRERILTPGLFDRINDEARLIIFALIETGCRPSEIANLLPEHIYLDGPVPYISIQPTADREIKTHSSIREIPLVGVSLEAMKCAPSGFPRYRDKPDSLSAFLMSTFRSRGLFPTDQHRIYSFRHSFEKRMQEAGIDYGLRCILMGHATSRPEYGDGGSLQYRQKELLKIVIPYREDLFSQHSERSG